MAYEKARDGAVPLHCSPHCSKPAPCPTPQSQVLTPAVPVRLTPQAAAGTGVGQAATEPPLPQQRLFSEVPLTARGARWQLRQKPYAPWNPSQTQLLEVLPPHWGGGMGYPKVCLCARGGSTVQRGQVQHEVDMWAWLLPEAGFQPAGWQGPLPVHPPWWTGHLPTLFLQHHL